MHIYRFIKGLFQNIKYQRILNKVYEEDEIIAKLSYILGVQFRRDWIGRLYAVINPVIKDGKYDFEQTYEYTATGYNNIEYVKQWLFTRMGLIQNFIQTENLFDILTFDIKQLDDNGNYLFIIFPVTLNQVLDNIKGSIIELLLIGSAIGAYLYFTPTL